MTGARSELPIVRVSERRALVSLCAIAVAVRAVYVLAATSPRLSDDEISFWAIAGNVATGRGFSYLGQATAWRPPLYASALGAARWLGASVREVEVGQALLGAVTVVALYGCVRRLSRSPLAGLAAGAAGAVYPPFVYFSGRLLSENLEIPMYGVALWLSLEWLERGGTRRAVLCGAGWGLAILARPTAIPLWVGCAVTGAVGAIAARRTADGRRGGEVLAVVVVAGVVLAPWVLRDAAAVGDALPVTSNEGFALWAANRRDTNQLENVLDQRRYPGMQDYAVYGRAFPGITALAHQHGVDFPTASEAARDAFFRRLAEHDIAADPVRFVARTAARSVAVLLPAPKYSSQTTRTGTAAKIVLWLTSGPLIVAGVVGLEELVRRHARRLGTWLLVVTAVLSLGLVATHVPYIRYRVDGLDPVLIVAASTLVARLGRDVSGDEPDG